MAESTMSNSDPTFVAVTTPAAGYAVGEVIQLADGRAGALRGQTAKTVGQPAAFTVQGKVTLAKTASIVILKGAPLYWDRSAGTVTPLKALAGADFAIGVAYADAASAAATVVVDLNIEPQYTIDILRDPTDTAVVNNGTMTMGPGYVKLLLTTDTEAQTADALSQHSIPLTIPFIVEGRAEIAVVADDAAVDVNIGIANATHADDADSITEAVFVHLDGDDLSLDAESDDGTTNTSADTLVDVAEGVPFDFAFDCRDLSAIKIYVNGVRVLAASDFALDDATGPMKLLAHLEKASNNSPGEFRIHKLGIRAMDLVA